ncbi:phosphoglycerate mutase family protein [Flavobacterium sp.]|uniref:phosphoglycerate mutase family protein n=1 Tax=Flavobacterium sp. TaxID=239 RepID=UPI004047FC7C
MKKSILVLFFCTLFSFAQETTLTDFVAEKNVITKIILLRHAEKEKDGSKDPKLSKQGMLRAEKLNFMLSDFSIDKLFSTAYIRTQKTLGAISQSRNITISNYEARDKNFAEQLVRNEMGKTIIVAGHSNTIPALVNVLIKEDKYKDLSEEEYGKLWILTFSNEELIDCSLFNF